MTTDAAIEAPDLGESALVCQLPWGGPEDIIAWIENADHGDGIIYFAGHLAVARDSDLHPFGRPMAAKIDKVAAILMRARDEGLVSLAQKRVVTGCYHYIARRIRRSA